MDKHGVILLLSFLLFPSISFSKSKCDESKKLPSMGSFFEIQVSDCQNKSLDTYYLEITQILEDIESQMSLYQTQSPINMLNKNGRLELPEYFHNNLKIALDVSQKTNGAFDITILPALKLIQDSFKKTKSPPSDKELDTLRNLVDFKKIKLKKNYVTLKEKGMQISLDGLAKGYAVDVVASYLISKNIKNFLINFSGNMKWQGKNPQNKNWKIVIWDPKNLKPVDFKVPEAGAIASSGIDYNNYSEDKKWHHIINPKTLKPASHWIGTSIIGPSAALCDALSTATFASDKNVIQEFLKNYPEYKIWAIDPNNQIFKTL